MNGSELLIDSNIIINLLNHRLPSLHEEWIIERINQGVAISVITWIEVLGWTGHTKEGLHIAESLLRLCDRIELTPTIRDQTIALRQQHRIKLPDALIAATAQAQSLALLTLNEKDFEHIPEIMLATWPAAEG